MGGDLTVLSHLSSLDLKMEMIVDYLGLHPSSVGEGGLTNPRRTIAEKAVSNG